MADSESIPLNSLLDRREIEPLLKQFESTLPGVNFALLKPDGFLFAGSDGWDQVRVMELISTGDVNFMIRQNDLTIQLLSVRNQTVAALAARGPMDSILWQCLYDSLSLLLSQAMKTRDISHETLERYREINLLYNIGETIAASLDPEEIHRLVLDEARRIIQADAGGVLVPSRRNSGELVIRISFGEAALNSALNQISNESIYQAFQSHQPVIATYPTEENQPIETTLCAPLRTPKRISGVILLGRTQGKEVFSAGEEKLLMALARQAATAVENAHLFAHLTSQRDAIAAMKSHMDNIFASIGSGVITTDKSGTVTTLNRAAEIILEVDAEKTMGESYIQVLPGFGSEIAPLVNNVQQTDSRVVDYELISMLPHRGPVVLRLHLSPLKNRDQSTTGVAIVLDDLTQRRQLEDQIRQVRATFERYVVPQVVERLLSDPSSVKLGGIRQDVTVLFADIRNYTAFSTSLKPETLVEVLNNHLTMAAEAILAEEGTLDKFMGDAVMAIFNAPLSQPDHTLRAVRAALAMQMAIAELHAQIAPDKRVTFGIGISSGPAVVGNIGSTTIQNYTAIGDSVNMAERLQSQANAGQILLNATAHEIVKDDIRSRELGWVQFKGHTEPDLVFEVLGLRL